ncbi:MFS transporter [Acidipropionibacterium thoenii]|uniref:MFS transporter n=1 Tax=Acidipropionibacterium thoenii TaxID=1751 RepID=UPI00041E0BCD|nr:MFS transporter [Acidipropionibacterium thoenii]
MLGTTLPTSIYASYEQAFGFELPMVTVIFAVYAAGVLAGLFAFGRWSDTLGRKPMLTAALGLSAGIFVGTATATMTELASDRRRAALLATCANVVGLGLGPVLGGLLVAWLPNPLRTPYIVHLGLVAVALVLLLMLPETVERQRGARPQAMPLAVPEPVRRYFTTTAILGFVGFAVVGLFTAVAPSIGSQLMGVTTVLGETFLVTSVYAGSTAGQLILARLDEGAWEAVAVSCLAVGSLVLALAVMAASWPLLAASGLIAGVGHGVAFSRRMATLSAHAPDEQRAAVSSAYFVVAYIAISVPVVAEGFSAQLLSLVSAAVGFSVVMALLAIVAGVLVHRRAALR